MKNLLNPSSIGDVTVRNRIVLPPMQMGKAGKDGEVTEKLIDHYGRYGSEVGTVIVEHSFVLPEGRYAKGQLGIDKDELVFGLEKLAEAVKGGGATVLIQLNHAGLKANGAELDVLDFDYEGSLSKYSRQDLDEIIKGFVKASRRAMDAGFDGVEVHGAHGFLLSQFVSPITNDREDEFGGDLENRIRFPLKVVEKVGEKIGKGILSYRLGATDLDPKGFTIDEAKVLAENLEGLGLDLIDVSGGLCGGSPEELESEQGYFVPYAREVGEVVSIPVVGVGGITDPVYANELVKNGGVELIAVGRAQLNDPTWAKRARKELG
jgi:2,4-dienoyl-CoA reductase-like NADH-dependent reductase (Old Yellow Enzyme family)